MSSYSSPIQPFQVSLYCTVATIHTAVRVSIADAKFVSKSTGRRSLELQVRSAASTAQTLQLIAVPSITSDQIWANSWGQLQKKTSCKQEVTQWYVLRNTEWMSQILTLLLTPTARHYETTVR